MVNEKIGAFKHHMCPSFWSNSFHFVKSVYNDEHIIKKWQNDNAKWFMLMCYHRKFTL